MKDLLQQVANSKLFQQFVVGVILLAGVLVGMETSEDFASRHHTFLSIADKIVITIFIVEILIKMGAHGTKPWRYFLDGWNIFDFAIVAVCLLPLEGQFAAVLRLARILRVLRLVHKVPRLQLLVNTLLKSIPSMGYVGILLFLLFYIYGVMGVFLFHQQDPVHFGSLTDSMISLFRTVTMEDWTDLMYAQIYAGSYTSADPTRIPTFIVPVIFFVSFILIGTMVMLNLFIGVIMNSMNELQAEAELAARVKHQQALGHVTIMDDIKRLERQLTELRDSLEVVAHRIQHETTPKAASTET